MIEIKDCLPEHTRKHFINLRNVRLEAETAKYQARLKEYRGQLAAKNMLGRWGGQQTEEWKYREEFCDSLATGYVQDAFATCQLYDIPLTNSICDCLLKAVEEMLDIQYGHALRAQGQGLPGAIKIPNSVLQQGNSRSRKIMPQIRVMIETARVEDAKKRAVIARLASGENREPKAQGTPTPASANLSKPLVFVSCGQSTPAERQLGEAIATLVEQETGCGAYFAQNQTSFEGVTENILKTLHRAVGFIAIMHPRGNVSNPNSPTESTWVRGSVWIEQEIAIAAFIAQALQLPMQVRAYVHESIQREGLRDKLHLNPKLFREDSEILKDLAFLLPSWRGLSKQGPREPLSLKANMHYRREALLGDDERYLLMFNVENNGENDATDFLLDVEFPGAFYDESGHVALRGAGKPGFHRFQVSNTDTNPPIQHLYPDSKTPDILTFHYGIHGKVKRERPELLQETVTATVYSGNMKPKVTSRTIAELMD